MLCASIKGLSMCSWELQKDQVVPHRTLAETFFLENEDSYTFLLEKLSLWLSVGH